MEGPNERKMSMDKEERRDMKGEDEEKWSGLEKRVTRKEDSQTCIAEEIVEARSSLDSTKEC